MEGKKRWYIVDGYRPPIQPDPEVHYKGHEAIMILNTHEQDANITFNIYYEDREPIENIHAVIPAKRVRMFYSTDIATLGHFDLPVNLQYSMEIQSDIGVIVQYGRLDIQQSNMAYLALMAYGE